MDANWDPMRDLWLRERIVVRGAPGLGVADPFDRAPESEGYSRSESPDSEPLSA